MTDVTGTYSLVTTLPLWIGILLILFSVVFSIWSYRQTTPPVSTGIRTLLAGLRTLGLAGGIWFLWSPILTVSNVTDKPPKVAVLLDRSASMGLASNGVTRAEEADRILQSAEMKALAGRSDLRLMEFADSVTLRDYQSYSPAEPNGPLTDIFEAIAGSLRSFKPDDPSAIILLSDGDNNSGADPVRYARQLESPVYTIGIGSSKAARDLMITDILTNSVVYEGSRIPVEVACRAEGCPDRTMTVTLRDVEGKSIDRKEIVSTGEFFEERVTFDYVVKAAGRIPLTVEISPLEDELTPDNNRRTISITSLTNRIRILVIAGQPDYGLGDLIRRLKSDEHFEVSQRTSRGKGFYEGNWPDEAVLIKTDLVILHHFPSVTTPREQFEQFVAVLQRLETPICLIDGGDLDPVAMKELADCIPVINSGVRSNLADGQVTPIRRHAIIADPDETDSEAKWAKLPPAQYMAGAWSVTAGSEILAEFSNANGKRQPALVIRENNRQKSAAILMRDLWRLGMASPGRDGIIEPLIDRLVRWLVLRRSDKRVQLSFSKEQFSTREKVIFRVSCFDEGLKPVDGADVFATIKSAEGDPIRLAATGSGQGHYDGSFMPWGSGKYEIQVEASLRNSPLGRDDGVVLVEPFSIELIDTRLNESLLRGLAEATHGRYVPADSAAFLLNALHFPLVSETTRRKLPLSGGWQHLTIVVMALSLEWLIRMRLGML